MVLEDHDADARPATLEEETRTVIEEARMVLPGIQAFLAFSLLLSLTAGFKNSRIWSKFFTRLLS
jgi:hypothetical protein